VTIANGVDTKFFTKTNNRSLQDIRNKLGLNNKKIVLFVGRITPEKGVHLLIAAMAIVKKVFPEAVLILIGPDFLTPVSARLKTDLIYQQFERLKKNYRDHLSDLISRHGLDVVRLGLTPQAELINFYSLADVVVLPSFEEAGPLPVLEAMSCQVPMVATEVDGIKDYLSPEAGFLVAPNDVAALAEKIITYLDNTRLCKKMGLAGREWVERKFTWDHTVENLMAAYAGLVRKPSVQEEVYELEKAA
jgi:glycosyltransferase involved in cell wall biosynthesis